MDREGTGVYIYIYININPGMAPRRGGRAVRVDSELRSKSMSKLKVSRRGRGVVGFLFSLRCVTTRSSPWAT